jgi:hypothetical protein
MVQHGAWPFAIAGSSSVYTLLFVQLRRRFRSVVFSWYKNFHARSLRVTEALTATRSEGVGSRNKRSCHSVRLSYGHSSQ